MPFTDRYSRGYGVSHPPPYSPRGADRSSGSYPAAIGGPGGFAFMHDPVPPPGADPKLWSSFLKVDADRSGSISVFELQTALVNGDWTPFDLDTVKLLMNLFDQNRSGDISFAEFTGLWQYIEDWQRVFRHFDKDGSGTIDTWELQSALNQFGMKLSPHLLSLLVAKFASATSGSEVGDQTITFDRFMRACVFVKQFTESYQSLDMDKGGQVQLNYEQFMKFYFMLP
jgi:Ca2+-binding EF-hand superfamily protein